MKTKITYGLILGVSGIAFQLIGFLLDAQNPSSSGINLVGILLGLVNIAVSFTILLLGVRAVRDTKPDQSLTFGQGVGAGIVIIAVAAVIGAIYTIIHFSFIHVGYADAMIAANREALESKGMADEAIQMTEKFMRLTLNPFVMAILGFFSQMIFGTIGSLIVAAITKRAPKPMTPPVMPPVGQEPPAL